MHTGFQARWVSKQRRDNLKRTGRLGRAVLLDSLNGSLIVEPADSHLGDGHVLSREDADFELRDVWCLDAKSKLRQARELLGLSTATDVPALVGAAS
jgi:hypothetical protein